MVAADYGPTAIGHTSPWDSNPVDHEEEGQLNNGLIDFDMEYTPLCAGSPRPYRKPRTGFWRNPTFRGCRANVDLARGALSSFRKVFSRRADSSASLARLG
jgi:hypothetical protein